MTADTPLLVCEGVTKQYGALTAVKQLSFTAGRGEILGIGGPNGAGKTTLFEVMSGLNPATSGRVLLEGRDITHASPEAICHAGIARTFQLNSCFDSLSVRENIAVGAIFGRMGKRMPSLRASPEMDEATEAAMELVGLAYKRDQIAGGLPVLERKLLMVAGAMATQPKLLLMDESVGGLTHAETDLMMDAVRKIAATGVTIILIEHVMRFLVALSDRVMIMHHGERIYEGSAAGLVQDRTVVDVYLGEGASVRLAAMLNEAAHEPT